MEPQANAIPTPPPPKSVSASHATSTVAPESSKTTSTTRGGGSSASQPTVGAAVGATLCGLVVGVGVDGPGVGPGVGSGNATTTVSGTTVAKAADRARRRCASTPVARATSRSAARSAEGRRDSISKRTVVAGASSRRRRRRASVAPVTVTVVSFIVASRPSSKLATTSASSKSAAATPSIESEPVDVASARVGSAVGQAVVGDAVGGGVDAALGGVVGARDLRGGVSLSLRRLRGPTASFGTGTDGADVGADGGAEDGAAVGSDVGASVGRGVGRPVGTAVGASVGAADGLRGRRLCSAPLDVRRRVGRWAQVLVEDVDLPGGQGAPVDVDLVHGAGERVRPVDVRAHVERGGARVDGRVPARFPLTVHVQRHVPPDVRQAVVAPRADPRAALRRRVGSFLRLRASAGAVRPGPRRRARRAAVCPTRRDRLPRTDVGRRKQARPRRRRRDPIHVEGRHRGAPRQLESLP